MFYSKSTGGFYDKAIHGDAIPTDAFEITQELHTELLAAQSAGKVIASDDNGKPIAVEVLVDPGKVVEAKKQVVRALREQVLERLNGIAGRAVWRGNTALAEACYVASEALLDITKDLPSDPDSVELVMFSRYLAIRQTAIDAAPSLATAFAQVDV